MIAIVLGVVFGGGVVLLYAGLRPARRSLGAQLALLEAEPAVAAQGREGTVESGLLTGVGRRAAPLLRAAGLPTPSLRADLALADRPLEDFLALKAGCALLGATMPWAIAGLALLAGQGTGWWLPTSAGLLLGVAGFFLPDGEVRGLARQRREELRNVLATVLDLAVLGLAGGAGVEHALHEAADEAHGWAADEFRHSLTTAQITRTPLAEQLEHLGERSKVSEISELAAMLSLAGTEGAKIRASLEAKATAMRRRELAAADGEAQAATERMTLPVVLQLAGFLIFIGVPALAHVMAGM
ncbi:type II secretion system F family protein [Streptomyces boninensis]|uniref:type II secretion system F family protein n=1 Tax=Streptomyces boninensis TaxID=2039455 RepID=UPI003B2191F4